MKYWENGFYLNQNETKTRKEITDDEWRNLLNAQSKGKEIYTTENGTPNVRDRILTNTEQLQSELCELMAWFDEYDNQVKQYQRCERLGIKYDKDINKLDKQAKQNAARITEIREILKNE